MQLTREGRKKQQGQIKEIKQNDRNIIFMLICSVGFVGFFLPDVINTYEALEKVLVFNTNLLLGGVLGLILSLNDTKLKLNYKILTQVMIVFFASIPIGLLISNSKSQLMAQIFLLFQLFISFYTLVKIKQYLFKFINRKSEQK